MEQQLLRAQAVRAAAHDLHNNWGVNMTSMQAAASSMSESSGAWQVRAALQSAVTCAVEEAEAVVKQLAEGQDPSRETCASLIVSSMDAITALAQRISSLEGMVVSLKQEVVSLKQEGVSLKQEVEELRGDNDLLLFRELATQTVSKIIRKATGYTVWDARLMLLSDIKDGLGSEVYRATMQQYPLLKNAVKTACNQGRSIAHPVPVPPATEQSLRALIQRAVGGPKRPGAEQLLDCLVALATELKEPLFVAAQPPS
jgi:hypothetical protein